MRAPCPATSFELCNGSGANARVRLHCGERRIWDAWAPAHGSVDGPALNPERLSLRASVGDPVTRVRHSLQQRDLANQGRYLIGFCQDRGALLFTLRAAHELGEAGLCLLNTTSRAVDFRLAIHDSPYEMAGHLLPGAGLVNPWAAPLRLELVVEGRSLSLPLVAAAGRWRVEPTSDSAGWRVLGPDATASLRSDS